MEQALVKDAALLRALCQKERWLEYGPSIMEELWSNADLKVLYDHLSALHGSTDGSFSLDDLALFVTERGTSSEQTEALMMWIDGAKAAPEIRGEVLRLAVNESIGRNVALKVANDIAVSYNRGDFDLKQYSERLRLTVEATEEEHIPPIVYTESALPDLSKDRPNICPLGLSEDMDDSLGGGGAAGELIVFLGGAKSGKTSILSHVAANNGLAGRKVLAVSSEISKELWARRVDSALTGQDYTGLITNPGAVKRARSSVQDAGGEIILVDWSDADHSPSELIPLAEKYGPIDLVIMDYLGEKMVPDYTKSYSRKEQRHQYSRLFQDTRSVAKKLRVPFFTGWQTNREGAQADVVSEFYVAEVWDLVCKADILLGISRSKEELASHKLNIHTLLQRFGGTARVNAKFLEDFDRNQLTEVSSATIRG